MKRDHVFAVAVLTLAALVVWPTAHLLAQWPEDGATVCTGSMGQHDPQIIPDGVGGSFVTWDDGRNSHDIYAQRLDSHGNPLWAVNGVVVCTGSQYSGAPFIAPDDAGGAIIVWVDWRGADADIYAQRIDGDGNSLWTLDGEAVCTTAENQHTARIVADGSGGALISWSHVRAGVPDGNVYAQRLDANGSPLWDLNGAAVCTLSTGQWGPALVGDGVGGAIISWSDYRNGLANTDVYAQRIYQDGSTMWDIDGVPVSEAAQDQKLAVIAPDGGGGAIIAWQDWRSGVKIYAQRIDAYGIAQWTADGIPVGAATGSHYDPVIASDGGGGAVIAWTDGRVPSFPDIYAQRVDHGGDVLWTTDGVPVCTATGNQRCPEITSDGFGGTFLTWEDHRGAFTDIYVQKLRTDGAAEWETDGLLVCGAPWGQAYAQVASDGEGGAVAVWQDGRDERGIYAQRATRNGYWGYPAPYIHTVQDVPGDQGGLVNLTWYASRLDLWPDMVVSNYTLWRAIGAARAAHIDESLLIDVSDVTRGTEGPVFRSEERGGTTYFWELVDSQDAYHIETYAHVLPTLFDSTAVTDDYHYFQVIAHTDSHTVYWVSLPDSGYSIDNLAPATPRGLAGDAIYDPAGLDLVWNANSEEDLSHYSLHRGPTEDFVPSEGNRIASPTDTTAFDSEWTPGSIVYYKLSAIDIHDNESAHALLTPSAVTGVDDPELPTATRLLPNTPNPFNPTTRIAFELAEPADVSLAVYDVSGRLVRTLVEGRFEAGRHAEVWNGRNNAGAPVGSGVYFCRFRAGGHAETSTMVLLK